MSFKFVMGQKVKIVVSGETGHVIGQARFAHASDSFLVRFKAGDGRAIENWWTVEALEPDE